jgi:hypothetical protein
VLGESDQEVGLQCLSSDDDDITLDSCWSVWDFSKYLAGKLSLIAACCKLLGRAVNRFISSSQASGPEMEFYFLVSFTLGCFIFFFMALRFLLALRCLHSCFSWTVMMSIVFPEDRARSSSHPPPPSVRVVIVILKREKPICHV